MSSKNVSDDFPSIILRTGIFVTPGTILQECGSIGMSLAMWCLCGVISLITALPFTELCSVVPQSGSQYIYVHEAFKDLHPFWGHTPGFIYVWVDFVFMRPATVAIHTLVSTEYMYPIVALVVSDEFDSRYGFWIKNAIGTFLIKLKFAFPASTLVFLVHWLSIDAVMAALRCVVHYLCTLKDV